MSCFVCVLMLFFCFVWFMFRAFVYVLTLSILDSSGLKGYDRAVKGRVELLNNT